MNKVERMDGVRFEQKTLPFCPQGRPFERRLERFVTASESKGSRITRPLGRLTKCEFALTDYNLQQILRSKLLIGSFVDNKYI